MQCADLNLAGSLVARGGAGGRLAALGQTQPATESASSGGGGSGGAIRLDLTRSVSLACGAFLDVQGGAGGRSSLFIEGGAGGHGAVRIREGVDASAFASPVQPPASLAVGTGQGTNEHPFSFATSGYYRSQAGQPVQRLVDSIVTFAVKRTNASGPVDPTDPRLVFNVGVPGSLLVHLGPAYISHQVAQLARKPFGHEALKQTGF